MGLAHNKHELPSPLGRRLALLICNGNFPEVPNYKLLGPAKDAKLLKAVLSDAGTCRFNVCSLVDRGLLEVRREIARICADASGSDTLLIYYSGNGFPGHDGSLYLLVADSDGEYPHATALDAEFILSQLRESKCRRIVLVVDGCHAGAFFTHNRGIPNGLYAITSCGADETCVDTPDGGAFTLALCAGLRNAAADTDGDGRCQSMSYMSLSNGNSTMMVIRERHKSGYGMFRSPYILQLFRVMCLLVMPEKIWRK